MGWDRTDTRAMQGMWDTLLANDFMLGVIFISAMCLHQNWPQVRYFRNPGEGRGFVSKAGPGELQLISAPHGTMPTWPSAELRAAALLGLIQDLQQLLYPFRCCSFNCPYKPGLPDLSLFCRPFFVYKEIRAATQFRLPVAPLLLSLCKNWFSAGISLDFCTKGNVWTGRNLHPAPGVVKPSHCCNQSPWCCPSISETAQLHNRNCAVKLMLKMCLSFLTRICRFKTNRIPKVTKLKVRTSLGSSRCCEAAAPTSLQSTETGTEEKPKIKRALE